MPVQALIDAYSCTHVSIHAARVDRADRNGPHMHCMVQVAIDCETGEQYSNLSNWVNGSLPDAHRHPTERQQTTGLPSTYLWSDVGQQIRKYLALGVMRLCACKVVKPHCQLGQTKVAQQSDLFGGAVGSLRVRHAK